MENEPFKAQSTLNSNWLPISKAETPNPRPGSCDAKPTEEGMNFIKHHTLVDKAVPTVHKMPFFIKTSLGERLTVIAVDSGVPGVQAEHVDPGGHGGEYPLAPEISLPRESVRNPSRRRQTRRRSGQAYFYYFTGLIPEFVNICV